MKKISEKTLYQGQWLSLIETTYENKNAEEVKWESIRRNNEVSACVVIAKLKPSNRLVLIKQYRHPIDGYILGFPAGLIDHDPREALKELAEETGYVGKIVAVSPAFKVNAGTTNDNGYAIYVHVDEHDPCNQNPQQQLEPSEDISVHLVESSNLKHYIQSQEDQGMHIAANLWYLAVLSELVET